MGGKGSSRWLHSKRKTVETFPKLSMTGLRRLYDKGVSGLPDMDGTIGGHGQNIIFSIFRINGHLVLSLSYSYDNGWQSYDREPLIAIAARDCHLGGKPTFSSVLTVDGGLSICTSSKAHFLVEFAII